MLNRRPTLRAPHDKNAGMTEAQIHKIIPDVPTSKKAAVTPTPSPTAEPTPSVATNPNSTGTSTAPEAISKGSTQRCASASSCAREDHGALC